MNSADKFFKRTRVDESGCLIWIGNIRSDGYGYFHTEGKMFLAHRWLFERLGLVKRGIITGSDHLVLDHLCRNRACVRPSHLEIVTHAENIRRSHRPDSHGRTKTHCVHGHPFNEENTYLYNGKRHCRTCKRRFPSRSKERSAAYARARRARERLGHDARSLYEDCVTELIANDIPVVTTPPRVLRFDAGRHWVVTTL